MNFEGRRAGWLTAAVAVAVLGGVIVAGQASAASRSCAAPEIAVADSAGYEGSGGGTTTVGFVVTMKAPGVGCPASGTVGYRTVAGTAAAGADYLATTGSLTWTSPSSQTIHVQVVRDIQPEPDERFVVELFAREGLSIADTTAAGDILDDDGADPKHPRVEATVNSGICWWPATYCSIGLELNQTPRAPVSVRLHTVDGTALAGADYVAVKETTVTFPTGVRQADASVQLLKTPASGSYFYAVISDSTAGVITEPRARITIQQR